jgi:hypothetical protein
VTGYGAPVAQDDEKYTDPDLRERIKRDLQAGDKGGRKGQWSARKSQMLVQEYERRGGGYRGGKSGKQKDLERWTEENWQTSDGSPDARHGDETERYLPKDAWDRMSEQDKRKTQRAKRRGSRQGKQHVANTAEAQSARKAAEALPIDGYEDLTAREVTKRLSDLTAGQLRTIRDFERDHAGRKTVLEALDRAERRSS